MNVITKTYAALKISRPVNVLITCASVVIAGVICNLHGYLNFSIIFAALSAAFINAAGNIINDIFDVKTDELNNKKRVLQNNLLNVPEAKNLYILFTITAFILASLINNNALIISAFTTGLLYLYSLKLKKLPLAGNIVVAALTALAFLYGGVAVNNLNGTIIPALFAFLINFAREVIKDIEDMKGDAESGFSTFPIRYGVRSSKIIIAVNIVLAFILPFILWNLDVYKLPFFIIVIFLVNPVFVFILRYLLIGNLNKNLVKISMLLKLNMILGLLAIIFGV